MFRPKNKFFIVLLIILFFFFFGLKKGNAKEVVVYTSVDQIYSEPILKLFEKKTGIKVKALYDTEATKTIGLVNRLLAERKNPRADVFWNGEIVRTLLLKRKGILAYYRSPAARDIPAQFKDPEGYWTGFGLRARVIICNTRLVPSYLIPRSIFDLVDVKWKAKVAMGYPVLGTIATHMAALYAVLGENKFVKYLKDLKQSLVKVVSGNSFVRDMVVEGEAYIGITDTDDALIAIRKGANLIMIFPDQNGIGTFMIPNTVALIKGAPHPEKGKKLIDFLVSSEVERLLAQGPSGQIPVRSYLSGPPDLPPLSSLKIMKVNYEKLIDNLSKIDAISEKIFEF